MQVEDLGGYLFFLFNLHVSPKLSDICNHFMWVMLVLEGVV